MRYTVVWLPDAEQDLAAIWLAAPDRDDVTQACNEIDQRLRSTPNEQGESRDDGRRVLIVLPRGVVFRVFEDDRLVKVNTVWHT